MQRKENELPDAGRGGMQKDGIRGSAEGDSLRIQFIPLFISLLQVTIREFVQEDQYRITSIVSFFAGSFKERGY